MLTIFYSHDGNGGGGDKRTNTEESKTRFPEDPGMEDGRIPDGGGPADGFIDEKGHSTGDGFLGHVDDSEGTKTKQSADDGGNGSHR